jgi:hypothetical protein
MFLDAKNRTRLKVQVQGDKRRGNMAAKNRMMRRKKYGKLKAGSGRSTPDDVNKMSFGSSDNELINNSSVRRRNKGRKNTQETDENKKRNKSNKKRSKKSKFNRENSSKSIFDGSRKSTGNQPLPKKKHKRPPRI